MMLRLLPGLSPMLATRFQTMLAAKQQGAR